MTSFLSSKSWAVMCGLCIFGSLIVLQRLHTYNEPLDRDITLYAVFGHEMLAGRPLYSDLWDNKPPLLYATYALAEGIVGYGPGAVFLLNITAALISLLGLYWIGFIMGGRAAGLWAGFIWTLVCADLNLEANQPNAEVFLNACFVWFFALWLSLDRGSRWKAWVAGILLGVGCLYKPVMLFPGLMVLVVRLPELGQDSEVMRAFIRQAAQLGLGCAAVVCTVAGYFFVEHRFSALIDAVFRFNLFFANQKGSFLQHLLSVSWPDMKRLWGYGLFASLLPLALLALIGFGLGIRGSHRKLWIALAAYGLGAIFAVTSTGYLLSHYFQLLLPPLVIGSAWTLSQGFGPPTVHASRLSIAAGCLLTLWLVAVELPFYSLLPDTWSRKKFNGGEFVVTKQTAQKINQILAPNERFYNWGWETGLYFYSQRRPVTGVLFNNVLEGGPQSRDLTERVLSDLEKSPPELIVTTRWTDLSNPTRHPIPEWFLQRYRLMPARWQADPFRLLMRKGGNVERRTKSE